MNINKQSGESEINTEYASQWIEYLKKKNAVLSIVWPIFMCSTIICAISTFYFFQLSENTKLQTSTALSKLQATKENNDVIEAKLKQSEKVNIKLEESIALLGDAKTTLEQQNGDSVSQLDLSGQIIETLKLKISALKTENTLTVSALNKAKSLLTKKEIENSSAEKSLETKINTHNKERFTMRKTIKDGQVAFKALMSRQKEMRVEMNRLADVVDQQQQEINAVIESKNKVQTKLQASELKISVLEKDYNTLESSLKLAVDPISMTPKKLEVQSPTVSSQSAANSSAVHSSDGLEEIRAPIVKSLKTGKRSNTSANYDYDQISLDN